MSSSILKLLVVIFIRFAGYFWTTILLKNKFLTPKPEHHLLVLFEKKYDRLHNFTTPLDTAEPFNPETENFNSLTFIFKLSSFW